MYIRQTFNVYLLFAGISKLTPVSKFLATEQFPNLLLSYQYILSNCFGGRSYLRKQIHMGVGSRLGVAKSGIIIGKDSAMVLVWYRLSATEVPQAGPLELSSFHLECEQMIKWS